MTYAFMTVLPNSGKNIMNSFNPTQALLDPALGDNIPLD